MASRKAVETPLAANRRPQSSARDSRLFRLRPVAHAIALALFAQSAHAALPGWLQHSAQTPLPPAQAGSGRPSGGLPGTGITPQRPVVDDALRQSLNNMGDTLASIAAAQARQAAARRSAFDAPPQIPDGLADGGLKIDSSLPFDQAWRHAEAPEQRLEDGRVIVDITQTADKAVLNWESFNVGRDTTVAFEQDASWALLNRVNDPNARPSQIAGQITGDGTVMILNRNGVLFTGSSQVNVRNLAVAAADMSDSQFTEHGLYGANANSASFTGASGNVLVEAGAQIQTHTPETATQGGGYVLLAGQQVHNDGEISTPRGQATLAAGDTFYIRRGAGTDGNATATTRGNEVATRRNTGSEAGLVRNTGLIQASTGDITLTGHQVVQAGVALATTSVDTRGTLHLLNSASDSDGSVVLAEGSTSAILLEDSDTTALDAQRENRLNLPIGSTGHFDNLSSVADRGELSRVEIVSGGTVDFEGDSMTLATGGEVVVAAGSRSTVQENATVDVSGAVGVSVAMAANSIQVNIQGNEQRDSPVNRESGELNSERVWVDVRDLIFVPAGTNGYDSDRWYTAGGLLEVGGYLANQGRTVGEWMAQGGTVTVTGSELITQAGAEINVSGGTLEVATGYLNQTYLKGADGQLYELSIAPGDMLYTGVYKGFERNSERWGHTEYFWNPLVAPRQRLENGYTVGRDAGTLVVSTNEATLEGDLIGEVYQGERQSQAPQTGLEGYYQSQKALARRAQLVVGQYLPFYLEEAQRLGYQLNPTLSRVQIGGDATDDALMLNADWLNAQQLGGLSIAARRGISVNEELALDNGGELLLYSPEVIVNADITARSGEIQLGNVSRQAMGIGGVVTLGERILAPEACGAVAVTIGEGVQLNAEGLWNNERTGGNAQDRAWVNGGSVALRSTGDVSLLDGSAINVSSGATYPADGALAGGRGGDVALVAGYQNGDGNLTLDGEITAIGVNGGGTLTLGTGNAVIIGDEVLPDDVLRAGETAPTGLRLAQELVLGAGDVLPFDFAYQSNVVLPGDIVQVNIAQMRGVSATNPLVVEADWHLALGTYGSRQNLSGAPFSVTAFVQNANGAWTSRIFNPGDTIPAGAQLRTANALGSIAGVGFKVPVEVFPNGIPVNNYTRHVSAGTVLTPDMVAAAGGQVIGTPGTFLIAGAVLNQDAAVEPVVNVAPALFQSGFGRYDVSSRDGVLVTPGAQLAVAMPVYRAGPGTAATASGASPATALEAWLPPPVRATGTGAGVPRDGADLVLTATGALQGVRAGVEVGEGAVVTVDPGHTISLSGADVSVHGALIAQGGQITLTGNASTALFERAPWLDLAIDIGAGALLDVSGAIFRLPANAGGAVTGVSDAGRITLGGDIDEHLGDMTTDSLSAFVAVREGATLNAAGTVATLETPATEGIQVATHGGSISAASDSGIYLEGEMQLAAGGAGASGGRLAVALGVPTYGGAGVIRPSHAVLGVRELTLYQDAVPSLADPSLTGSSLTDPAEQRLVYGQAGLSAAQVDASGADQLSLLSESVISFDGDLALTLARSLHLYSSILGLSPDASDETQVTLAAPYVRLAGIGNQPVANVSTAVGAAVTPAPNIQSSMLPSQQSTRAGLKIEADQMDIRNLVRTGIYQAPQRATVGPQGFDRRGFDQWAIHSSGDIRFLAGVGNQSSTSLASPGDITMTAAQLYPATGAEATVVAGYRNSVEIDPTRRLVIGRPDDTPIPAQPYSVFGALHLLGGTIEQGGVVRAPLGTLEFGDIGRQGDVRLAPGSLTSVSAKDLVIPYGGTVDDIAWLYGGVEIDPDLRTVTAGSKVWMQALSLAVDDGAVLDLSGGGELRGAGFIPGRGGSSDVRYAPLIQLTDGGVLFPTLADNPVYAIVPGAVSGYAPSDLERGAVNPLIGQQITLGAGVPGLSAGTYTLMPSTYALLPGAFRVEVNGGALGGQVAPMRNGSWTAPAWFSIAGTETRDRLASQIILTPAELVRRYSRYNETDYSTFTVQSAIAAGALRAALPEDAKVLELWLTAQAAESALPALQFDGELRAERAEGGYGASVVVTGGSTTATEIVRAGSGKTEGFDGVSLEAEQLNALAENAERLVIGATLSEDRANNPGVLMVTGTGDLTLRSGAALSAAEIILGAGRGLHVGTDNALAIERGAAVNTLGQGEVSLDARSGYTLNVRGAAIIASNGAHNVLLDTATPSSQPAPLSVGVQGQQASDPATLYSDGSLVFATGSDLLLDDSTLYGARNLSVSLGAVNLGSAESLAAAAATGTLPDGFSFNQTVLERLLTGDTSTGAPAMETFSLSAAQGLNIFGDITLSTLNEDGVSTLDTFVLTTPAILGAGTGDNNVTIETGHLVWNGTTGIAPAPIGNDNQIGPGTGAGRLNIHANVIELGYGPDSRPSGVDTVERMILGFSDVVLRATEMFTANNKGELSVYQSRGDYVTGEGWQYHGGNLRIETPAITGEAGVVSSVRAGGELILTGVAGAAEVLPDRDKALGATLAFQGQQVTLDTSVILPSGKLTLAAEDDVTLTDAAQIDMAGREIVFDDVSRYSWGGSVILESAAGNIHQAAGSRINLSAEHNHAGSLTAVAVGDDAGDVLLTGDILGQASGEYDAGGTWVPYEHGRVDIRAQHLGDFAALNQRFTDGEIFGARHFQIKQGDLVIGDELQARDISVSLDGGHLTVDGVVDASGEQVGSIRLAAKHGLSLTSNAVLDAHGKRLRVDSYGQIIDAPNRAIVELNSGEGELALAAGARIDLRHGTEVPAGSGPGQHNGQPLGTVTLTAPRLGNATSGDLAIDAQGVINIEGARSIAVQGNWRYDDAEYGTDEAASGRPYQVIDQAYLDAKHADSAQFINAALGNDDLLARLSGLRDGHEDIFHLRPSVEIVSATAAGDLVIQGDLDLSGHRYESLNPTTQKTALYGSGEAGALAIRAGGDLNIYGSINDGFAPPPETPDDNGWVLLPGVNPYGVDVIVPGAGVTLAQGTTFPAGRVLNYDVPLQAFSMASGTELPVAVTLNQSITLPANTILRGEVIDHDGNVFAAGTLLSDALVLNSGSTLGGGFVLTQNTQVRSVIWPAGAPLPGAGSTGSAPGSVTLATALPLKMGAIIPGATHVVLTDDVTEVPLRPAANDQQGQNWAVAPMLPAGSQSWQLRLVAGADTSAADTRTHKPRGVTGNLTLSDQHYQFANLAGGEAAEPILVWGPDAWMYGYSEGQPVPADLVFFCDFGPGVCAESAPPAPPPTLVWGPDAWIYGYSEGQPVPPDLAFFCDFGAGVCVEQLPEDGGASRVYSGMGFSVVRTGIADLEMISAGDFQMDSLYGVYTAGTPAEVEGRFNRSRVHAGGDLFGGAQEMAGYEQLVSPQGGVYQAWYPEQGGNLLIHAGQNLTGTVLSNTVGVTRNLRRATSTAGVGNWLWRQGTGNTAGVQATDTAWWINFGSYVPDADLFAVSRSNVSPDGSPYPGAESEAVTTTPYLVGFTGFGTLGGGNLTMQVGGDAGALTTGKNDGAGRPRSEGVIATVASTGRVIENGELLLTGGGDLHWRIGGALNPDATFDMSQTTRTLELSGLATNLRGMMDVQAGVAGVRTSLYDDTNPADIDWVYRDAFDSTRVAVSGGLVVMPGDSVVNVNTLGPLVLGGVGDPGRVGLSYKQPVTGAVTQGDSWFSLWTERTALNLFSVGDDVIPGTQMNETELSNAGAARSDINAGADGSRLIYPGQTQLVSAAGNIYFGGAAAGARGQSIYPLVLEHGGIWLAPSRSGTMTVLSAGSIYGGGVSLSASSAPMAMIATPQNPAFHASAGVNNIYELLNTFTNPRAYFAFGANTAASSGTESRHDVPNRVYAAGGDIVDLRIGEIITHQYGSDTDTWYVGNGPVWLSAARDIINSGDLMGEQRSLIFSYQGLVGRSNLFLHHNATDISRVHANGRILTSNFNIAGPGLLEVSAGGSILMQDQASIVSLGPVVPGDNRRGADIAVMAGLANAPLDSDALLDLYLDPARLAEQGVPLADQPERVAAVYSEALIEWLAERYGFQGNDLDSARAVFAGLNNSTQQIFARQVLFAELLASGREYNDADGPRPGSYLRGRRAIEAAFPERLEEDGVAGDLVMFGDAGIQTLRGGDIHLLTPSGAQTLGVEGTEPAGSAGVVTLGEGSIRQFSRDSILLGQSRVMTVFGGDIQAWAEEGDINAGRGSQTTQVYTPPLRVYDQWGNIALAPDAPSSGAGIATLNPLPEVPPGDIDLIAPLGTIDAGEAGIRVSGNVNVAALQVVNADNIQVQGETQGIPVVAAVNVGALSSASAASTAASQAAETITRRSANQPSIITVEILGFGDETLPGGGASLGSPPASLEVIGTGPLSEQEKARLTEEERANLM